MMNENKLSVCIITYNEENNMRRCLESLCDLAHEIVVVDSISTDNTRKICAEFGAKVIEQAFLGYEAQKNFALDQTKHDIVLALDADEALSPELYESIKQALGHFTKDGYSMNRLTNLGGRWVRHSGWYPDKKIRLWNKARGRWGGGAIHESVRLMPGSTVGHLSGNLLHYSYPTIQHYINKINQFTDIASYEAFEQGKKANILRDIILGPFFGFIKHYFIKLGCLDGYAGFQVAIHSAYGKFIKYSKLKELWDKKA